MWCFTMVLLHIARFTRSYKAWKWSCTWISFLVFDLIITSKMWLQRPALAASFCRPHIFTCLCTRQQNTSTHYNPSNHSITYLPPLPSLYPKRYAVNLVIPRMHKESPILNIRHLVPIRTSNDAPDHLLRTGISPSSERITRKSCATYCHNNSGSGEHNHV